MKWARTHKEVFKMNNSIAISKKAVIAKVIIAATGIIAAVALPQVFHFVGNVSGTGAALGASLLPMPIPVLLAGFLGGPVAGVIAGVLSPVVSAAISGMPAAAMLPFMIIELGVYGLVSGLLSKTKLNGFVKLLITQVAGRAARTLAVIAAIYLFGNAELTLAAIPQFIVTGLFGIMIQWAVIPLLSERLERVKKLYE